MGHTIIILSYGNAKELRNLLQSVKESCELGLPHEIIVADGTGAEEIRFLAEFESTKKLPVRFLGPDRSPVTGFLNAISQAESDTCVLLCSDLALFHERELQDLELYRDRVGYLAKCINSFDDVGIVSAFILSKEFPNLIVTGPIGFSESLNPISACWHMDYRPFRYNVQDKSQRNPFWLMRPVLAVYPRFLAFKKREFLGLTPRFELGEKLLYFFLDFCLQLRERGKTILMTSNVVAYHNLFEQATPTRNRYAPDEVQMFDGTFYNLWSGKPELFSEENLFPYKKVVRILDKKGL